MVSLARVVVLALAAALCVGAVCGMTFPATFKALLPRTLGETPLGTLAGVLLRLLMGLALIVAAPESGFPRVLEAVGVLAIAAGVVLAIIGRERISRLVARLQQFPGMVIRVWSTGALAFGGFLVYGVW